MSKQFNIGPKRDPRRFLVTDVYQGVEDLYQENISSFLTMVTLLGRDLGIPKDIAEKTIKYYLVGIFNDGQNKFLLKPRIFKSSLIYFIAGVYFFIFSLVGRKTKKIREYEVLFDNCFSETVDENYEDLIERLCDRNIAILQTYIVGANKYADSKNKNREKKFCSSNLLEKIAVDSRIKGNFCKDISKNIYKSIFTNFWRYAKLNSGLGIDILQLSIRIYKSIAQFSTEIDGVNSKVLVSFNDNGFGPLRYYIYKKNFNNIFVIQNGYRFGGESNRLGDMYLHSDYYFGFGIRNIEIQKGMVCKKKAGVGSLRLHAAMGRDVNNESSDIQYDVIFLEQLSEFDVPAYKISSYKRCVKLLCEFAKKHKKLRIVYRTRLDRADLHFFGDNIKNDVEVIDHMLKDSSVIISGDMQKCSYIEMARARVVVFYTSTMGYEALGMGKKVINLNPDRFEMGLSQFDELGVVVDLESSIFEEKLNKILNSDNEEIKKYYEKKKFEFMNTEFNIVDEICNAVEFELSVSS